MNPQLLAQLPQSVRFLIALAVNTLGQGNEINDERLQKWIEDLAAGRVTEAQLNANIREVIIGEDLINSWVDAQLGDDDTPEEVESITAALLSGQQTFASVIEQSGQEAVQISGGGGDIGDRPGLVGSGGTVLPSGATLVKVTNPSGSDADALFFVTYQAYGINFAYEVGDLAALKEVFPGGVADFDTVQTMAGAAFDESDFINVGFVDEIVGADESIQSMLERDLAAVGLESLPSWIRDDPGALAVFATSVTEGWSPGRTALELAKTAAFRERYGVDTGAFAAVANAIGTDDPLQVTNAYVAYENALRTSLLSIRGGTTDTSTEYLATLIATGWSPEEIVPVLQAEQLLLQSPGELAQTNEILRAFGLDEVDESGFVDILTGVAPSEIFDALNSAAALQALAEQGVDVDAEFLAGLEVFDTSTGLGAEAEFTDAARALARLLAENFQTLQTGTFDLSREDLIAASFGVANPDSGKSAAEIEEALGRIQREFAQRARGLQVPQAFLNQQGNLQVGGLSGL